MTNCNFDDFKRRDLYEVELEKRWQERCDDKGPAILSNLQNELDLALDILKSGELNENENTDILYHIYGDDIIILKELIEKIMKL